MIGLGLVGLLAAQIAGAAGCTVLGIDIDSKRVALASSLGLQAVVRQKAEAASQAFTAQRGFDIVLICADTASNDPVELAAVIVAGSVPIVAHRLRGLYIPTTIYLFKKMCLTTPPS